MIMSDNNYINNEVASNEKYHIDNNNNDNDI